MGFKPRRNSTPELASVLRERLERFLTAVVKLGGEGSLQMAPPLAAATLRQAHPDLPPGAEEFFTTVAGSLHVQWSLDEAAIEQFVDQLGDDFEDFYWGEIELTPTCFELVDPDTWSIWDETWRNKTVFAPTGSGDYLAVDLGDAPGQIVYLSHDLDGDIHGKCLAESLVDLLARWAPLGCVGAQPASWLPFLSKTGKYIDPGSAPAKTFISYIGEAAGGETWQQAKSAKYADLVDRVRTTVAAPDASFHRMTEAIADGGYGDEQPEELGAEVVERLGGWYGTDLAPAARALIEAACKGEPEGELGIFKARMPPRICATSSNAFVQALADTDLLVGAFSNMCRLGSARPYDSYFIEMGDDTAVFTGRSLTEPKYRASSLPRMAQLLEVAIAFDNVEWRNWPSDDSPHTLTAEAFAPLAAHVSCEPRLDRNHLDDFIAAFSPREPGPPSHELVALLERSRVLRANLTGDTAALCPPIGTYPDDLTTLSCGEALYYLLSGYLTEPSSATRELIEAARRHRARLVRDAAALLASLAEPVGPRHPGKHVADLRDLCRGGGRTQRDVDASARQAILDAATGAEEAEYVQEIRQAESAADQSVAWSNLAYHYRCAGEWNKLLPVADVVMGYDSAEGWMERGRALTKLGRYEDALEAYNRALLYPSIQRAEAYRGRLEAVVGTGDTSAAQAHLDWLDPVRRPTWQTAAASGRLSDAPLEELLARDEAIAEAAGDAFTDGDYAAALSQYEQLSGDAKTRFVPVLTNMAQCAQQLGDHPRTVALCDRALQREPTKHAVMRVACYSHYVLKDFKAMAAMAKRAVDVSPDDDYSWQQLAIANHQLGAFAEAAAANRKALELVPDNAYATANLGMDLWELGDHASAVTSFQRAFELDDALLSWARTDDEFAELRDDPRIAPLLT